MMDPTSFRDRRETLGANDTCAVIVIIIIMVIVIIITTLGERR
jgi:hypothetical protein